MRRLSFGIFLTLAAAAASASMQYRLQPRALARLSGPIAISGRVTIDNVPLDGVRSTLEVERFEVYAPDAVIQLNDALGTHVVSRPSLMFYRGGVVGDPESVVFLSVGEDIHGFVVHHDRKFAIHSAARERNGRDKTDERDVLVEETTEEDAVAAGVDPTFRCLLDQYDQFKNPGTPIGRILPEAIRLPGTESLGTGTATYTIRLAVETDGELNANFGGGTSTVVANVTNYVANMVGAISTIYQRDLRTDVQLVFQNSYADPATDPFSEAAGDLGTALTNFTSRWSGGSPPSTIRHNAAMEWSGKEGGGGLAWLNRLGAPSNEYGVIDSLAISGVTYDTPLPAVPNPNGNAGYQAATNVFDFSYWSIVGTAHELGHIVQSSHTHCTVWQDADNATYGISPPISNATRPYVDLCYSGEGGCYTNGSSGAVNANLPAELGTIMSYCHLINLVPGGYGMAIRFTFGQAGETSTKITHLMMSQLDTISPNSPVITAPASVAANSSGNAASTPTIANIQHVWSITNGTFTGGCSGTTCTADSVTFSVTAVSPAKLFVTAINTLASGSPSRVNNASSDYVNVTVITLAAPTSVAAAATSPTNVHLTWTGSCSNACHIYRSVNNSTYTQVTGSPTGTSFDDTTVGGGVAYLYKVRAFNGTTESGDSNIDLATTVVFTTDPLVAQTTVVNHLNLTELRTAVNAVRKLANGGVSNDYSFTDSTITAGSTLIKAVHITDLRTALDQAMTTLSLTTGGYTDTSLSGVNVKAVHLQELRNRVK